TISGQTLATGSARHINHPRLAPSAQERGYIMLEPEPKRKLLKMTAEEQKEFERVVAEELAAKDEKIRAARPIARRLKNERKVIADLIAQLRQAREEAGVSLNEMQARTGIMASLLSMHGYYQKR
ncbi:MAG: hypothetical protein KDA99_26390, partial [Planctomycetales bacterium]|nr:hypothetical protein [Planctomycetales bacterium]